MKKNLSLPAASIGIGLLLLQSLVPLTTPARDQNERAGSPRRSIELASLSSEVTVAPVRGGTPWIALSEGRALVTSYVGRESAVEAIRQNRARPSSLAWYGSNRSGVGSLVCGYASPTGSGFLAVHRGAAMPAHQVDGTVDGRRAPFRTAARVFDLPEAADFLGTGDFDADGRDDLVAAAHGGEALYLLRGDGLGGLLSPERIDLPGRITALVTGEINRGDGLTDVVVGVTSGDGPRILVFEGPMGALRSRPESIILPSEATSLALAQLDDSYEYDLAVAAGTELLIVHGRDRGLYRAGETLGGFDRTGGADANRMKVESPPKVSRESFSFNIVAIAAGNFAETGNHQTELAAMSEDGTLLYLQREHSGTWQVIADVRTGDSAAQSANRCLLARVKVTSLATDDLVVIDRESRRAHLVSGGPGAGLPSYEARSLDATGGAVAALPLRSNRMALDDLALLTGGRADPSMAVVRPAATFTVTNTNDSGPGSYRQALIDANNNPGIDTITFEGDAGLQIIRPETPLPTVTDPAFIGGPQDSSGAPMIELDGSNAGSSANGLTITAGNSVVKGLAIGNFNGHAISLQQGGNNMIMNNYLGTDATCTENRGNTGEGVNIQGSNDNTVMGNTIVFNGDGGSVINSNGNVVRDNNLGTDATMTVDKGNQGAGFGFANASNNRFEANRVAFNQLGFIGFGSTNNAIGGVNATDANIIGLNGTGISLISSNSNLTKGNFIGTNPVGDNLGNQGSGIELNGTSSNNNIGGATLNQGNTIRFNTFGIFANPGANGNLYLLNSISNNSSAAISNNGGNRGILPPQLLSATASASDTLITGRFFGFPNRQFALQFYLGDDTPLNEGKAPLGGFTVATNPGGFVDFSGRFSSPLAALKLTALATSVDTNDTSEFSNGVGVASTMQPDLEAMKSGPGMANCGDTITYTITVTNVGFAAAVGGTVVDTLPGCVADEITVTTSPEGLLSYALDNRVVTVVRRLDPGDSVTITIEATLTENCGEAIVNFVMATVGKDTNLFNNEDEAVTSVNCAKITGISVEGKHVIVSGLGFERGDQIEINGVFAPKTKFRGIDELLAKKGKRLLMTCDPANPDRMDVIRLIRPSNAARPVLDTEAFATCP